MLNDDCIDGQYSETFPNPAASLSTPPTDYSSSNYVDFIYDVLELRFPIGEYILDGGYTK